MPNCQAVYRYVVLEENFESVGVRMVDEVRRVETIGDQKYDLAPTGPAIMKQFSGRMDGIVESFGWAGTKISRRGQGRFDHSELVTRWRSDKGDGAGRRGAAVILSIL